MNRMKKGGFSAMHLLPLANVIRVAIVGWIIFQEVFQQC